MDTSSNPSSGATAVDAAPKALGGPDSTCTANVRAVLGKFVLVAGPNGAPAANVAEISARGEKPRSPETSSDATAGHAEQNPTAEKQKKQRPHVSEPRKDGAARKSQPAPGGKDFQQELPLGFGAAIIPADRRGNLAALSGCDPFESNKQAPTVAVERGTAGRLEPGRCASAAQPMLANADGGLEKETLVSRLRAAQGRFGAKARREMADWLAALGIGGKVSTPRSEVPMPALKSAPRKASLLSRRRMLFSCPACLRDVVTPRNMSGRRMRCPQCGSALLAPHPHKSGMAWNRESHLESLLHPELYAQPGPPRPRVLGIPVPKVQNALLACALLILVAAAWRLTHFSPRDALRSLAGGGGASDGGQQHPAAADLETSALQAKAEQTVRDFLQADGWEKKSEFVRDAIRVKALMRDFYGRCGGDEASAVDRVTAGPPGYYAMENLPQPTNLVAAVLGGGRQHMFRVEHLPEGARIEWESSVCYSPMPWEQVLCCSADSGPHLLRVAASPDSYYNHGFSEEEFLSVRLHDPATGESLGNGYIPRKSEDAGRLAVFLNGASPQRPELLMLEVRPVAKSDIHRQVQIVRFIKGGFRSPEAPVMAAANTGDPD